MAKAKAEKHIETASERLARLKDERIVAFLNTPVGENEKLYDFTSPIGLEWKLRKANIQAFVNAGALPMTLVERMVQAQAKGQTEAEALNTATPAEQAANIALVRVVACYCAVEPRIVQVPSNDNEVAYADVPPADLTAIAHWAMSGGDEAASLDNFR